MAHTKWLAYALSMAHTKWLLYALPVPDTCPYLFANLKRTNYVELNKNGEMFPNYNTFFDKYVLENSSNIQLCNINIF